MQLVVLYLAVNSVPSESTIVSAFSFSFFFTLQAPGCVLCAFEISGDITSFKRPFLTCLFYIPALADGVRLLVCLLSAFSAKCLAVVSNVRGDIPACEKGCGESGLLFWTPSHCLLSWFQLPSSKREIQQLPGLTLKEKASVYFYTQH